MIVAALALGCGKKADDGQTASDQAGESGSKTGSVKVGLVFDVGGLGDKSFNDAAYRGLESAKKEFGIKTRYIEPGDGSDRESALRQLAAQGYDLVIGVGYIFSDDITRLARSFPKVKFACIDYTLPAGESATPPNLVGLRFREHEGSFLVGAIAGKMSQSKKVGFVGGMKIPLIRKFEAGYEAGVKEVCPECEVLSAYAGTEPKAFADPGLGQELAITQYDRGADIIFHASGKTGEGVFTAAKQRDKMVIGVDSDQFDSAPCCMLTSMVKYVDVAVHGTIRAVVEGTFESGVKEFGLADKGVGFVYDDNNKDRLPREVVDAVNGLAQKIIDGTLTVPSK